jgi:hypothetical protein
MAVQDNFYRRKKEGNMSSYFAAEECSVKKQMKAGFWGN